MIPSLQRLLAAIRIEPYPIHSCFECGRKCYCRFEQGEFGYDHQCLCSDQPRGWRPYPTEVIEIYLHPPYQDTVAQALGRFVDRVEDARNTRAKGLNFANRYPDRG